MRLRGFHFTALLILAQPTSDPFSFIWRSSTTKGLERGQPPIKTKAELGEATNAGCSDLVSAGMVKIKGKLPPAKTKRLLISMTPSTETLGKTADPKECMWLYSLLFFP